MPNRFAYRTEKKSSHGPWFRDQKSPIFSVFIGRNTLAEVTESGRKSRRLVGKRIDDSEKQG